MAGWSTSAPFNEENAMLAPWLTYPATRILATLLALGIGASAAAAQPLPPTNVVARVTGQQLNVRWTTTSGEPDVGYDLVFRDADTRHNVTIVRVDRRTTSIDLTIPPGTQGTFTVQVIRIDGFSSIPLKMASEEILFTVEPSRACTAPPPTPTGVVGTRVLRTANIRWNNDTLAATSYVVRAGSFSGSSDLFNGDVGNVTSVGTDNLDPSIPLFVSVSAGYECGVSPPSPEIAVSAGGPLVCVPDFQTMCLLDGRFTVRLNERLSNGALTPAQVTRRFNDGGGWGFLNATQENVFVRVENLCATTGRYVVRFNAGSAGIPVSTAFDLFVGDNQGSIARTYTHSAGTQFLSFADTTSFNRCP
jgi:hypothetical protein